MIGKITKPTICYKSQISRSVIFNSSLFFFDQKKMTFIKTVGEA